MEYSHDSACLVVLGYSRCTSLRNSFDSCADEYPESLLSARCGVDVACGNSLVLESPDGQIKLCENVHCCLCTRTTVVLYVTILVSNATGMGPMDACRLVTGGGDTQVRNPQLLESGPCLNFTIFGECV